MAEPNCALDPLGKDGTIELQYQGRDGAWIEERVLRCLYSAVAELEKLRDRVGSFEARAQASEVMAEALQQSSYVSERMVLGLQEDNKRLLTRAKDAEEALDAWYRSPWLWAGVGAVVVVVLEVAAIALINSGD